MIRAPAPALARPLAARASTARLLQPRSRHALAMSAATTTTTSDGAMARPAGAGKAPFLETVRVQFPLLMRRVGRVLGPFMLQLAVALLFVNVAPAFAKSSRRRGATAAAVSDAATEAAAAAAAAAAAVAVSKPVPLWKKILEGASTSGAFKNLKAGDTRTEFAAILNSISSIIILGCFTLLAYVRHKQREISQSFAAKKELKKMDEYKENMYFEAVQDILKKINDPKTKVHALPCVCECVLGWLLVASVSSPRTPRNTQTAGLDQVELAEAAEGLGS